MDVLLLPTTGTIYTLAEIDADPIDAELQSRALHALRQSDGSGGRRGARLASAPTGCRSACRSSARPSLIRRLLAWRIDSWKVRCRLGLAAPGCVLLGVVGAHLRGQPLNHQLTDRGARFVRSCRTARDYRLFALPDSMPSKPGLVRDPAFAGDGIEVELWAVPEHQFGGLLAQVPPPLTIGNVMLEDGLCVKGFLCESAALSAAVEITRFGGWVSYLHCSSLVLGGSG